MHPSTSVPQTALSLSLIIAKNNAEIPKTGVLRTGELLGLSSPKNKLCITVTTSQPEEIQQKTWIFELRSVEDSGEHHNKGAALSQQQQQDVEELLLPVFI